MAQTPPQRCSSNRTSENPAKTGAGWLLSLVTVLV
jgi:hypothetical protein